MTIGEYFSGLLGGIKSLGIGMGVTWKELFTKKVTQQYPENRKTLVIPSRVRGELTMPHDQNNEHACTSCGICQMNCPNGTINITSKMIETEDGKKKKILDTYTYDLGMCTFCNLCVLTCPSDAIKFSTEFENAVFRRKSLKQKLNHEGSKLREKKKVVSDTPVVPKVAPAPKPTDTVVKETPEDKKAATIVEPKVATESQTEPPKVVVPKEDKSVVSEVSKSVETSDDTNEAPKVTPKTENVDTKKNEPTSNTPSSESTTNSKENSKTNKE